MPNPQAENGHIDIANEIAEVLAKTQLSGYESRVLWVLWRKTYGWHKKKDRISISQFSQATGIARRHIHKTLQRLIERHIVTKNGNSFITKWAFQKDYSRWKIVTEIGTKPQEILLIDKKKEIIRRENYTGRICEMCGFKEYILNSNEPYKIIPGLLQQHHIIWEMVNNRPKSDKSSDTINLCFKCHRKIHKNIHYQNREQKQIVTENGRPPQKSVTRFVTKNGAHKRKLTKETNNTKERSTILTQISNIILQFPDDIKPLVFEYIDITRLQNKTMKMSKYKELRLTNELFLLWSQYQGNEIDEKDFRQALKTTISNEAPNINYVRKVIEGIIRKRSARLRRGTIST